jgi:hypothetical protein
VALTRRERLHRDDQALPPPTPLVVEVRLGVADAVRAHQHDVVLALQAAEGEAADLRPDDLLALHGRVLHLGHGELVQPRPPPVHVHLDGVVDHRLVCGVLGGGGDAHVTLRKMVTSSFVLSM